MASSLLPPGSKDVICELIAAYYNGTEVEIVRKGQLTAAANSFGIHWASDKGRKKLVLRAWAKFTGLDRLAALLLFHWDEEELNDEETQDVRSAAKELRRHERKFREAVTWLCSSKDLAKQIQEHWLRTKGEPRNLVFGRYPTIDQRSESSLKYLEDHGIKHLKPRIFLFGAGIHIVPDYFHLVDIFCAFLINECTHKSPSAMPIKVCSRCKKLFSAAAFDGEARRRKMYCSTECQQSGHWTKGKQARADDRYVSRMIEEYGSLPRELHKRLLRPNVQKRLCEIENHWPSWKKIVEKIGQIRSIAAGAGTRSAKR